MKNLLDNPEKQTQLHQALDLIIQHATGKLPHGYRIEIGLTRGVATMILLEPDKNNITLPENSFEYSVIDGACAKAIEHSTPVEAAEAPQPSDPHLANGHGTWEPPTKTAEATQPSNPAPQSETPSDGQPPKENAG